MNYCKPFNQIKLQDLPSVGGKNASLGEMIFSLTSFGISIPDGFAITADAYRLFLTKNNLNAKLTSALDTLDSIGLTNIAEVGKNTRLGELLKKLKVKFLITMRNY